MLVGPAGAGLSRLRGLPRDRRTRSGPRDALWLHYPRPEEYFADPAAYTWLATSQFAGIIGGPWRSWDLNRLAFHPDLLDLAERFLGSADLRLYEAELWAKYAGAVDYDQSHHRDFGNHTLVVPKRSDPATQMTSLILLSDVAERGWAHKGRPAVRWGRAFPTGRAPSIDGGTDLAKTYLPAGTFAEEEISVTGPAGTLFSYRPDILHRGSRMIGERSARFTMSAHYDVWGPRWTGRVAWAANALGPELVRAHRAGDTPGALGLRVPRTRRSVLGRADPGRYTRFALPPVRFNALLLRAAGRDRSGIRAGALSRFAQQLHSGSGWSVPVRR